MASVQAPVVPVDTVLSEPSDASLQNVPALQRLPSSSTPIEMNTIPPVNPSQFVRSPASTTQSSESSHYPQLPATDALPPSSSTPHTAANTTNAIEEAQQAAQQPLLADSNVNSQPRIPLGPDQSDLSATPVDTLYSPLVRETTAPAIGPATDKPAPLPKGFEAHGPVLCLTLLLTTGSRHPFKLDEKYLKKRNVEVEGNNPINLSLYKFKELILRDWREGEPTVHLLLFMNSFRHRVGC